MEKVPHQEKPPWTNFAIVAKNIFCPLRFRYFLILGHKLSNILRNYAHFGGRSDNFGESVENS
jgi:hypothetical protein